MLLIPLSHSFFPCGFLPLKQQTKKHWCLFNGVSGVCMVWSGQMHVCSLLPSRTGHLPNNVDLHFSSFKVAQSLSLEFLGVCCSQECRTLDFSGIDVASPTCWSFLTMAPSVKSGSFKSEGKPVNSQLLICVCPCRFPRPLAESPFLIGQVFRLCAHQKHHNL